MKPAVFHPAARDVLRSFPDHVRKELGKAIYDLQNGEALGMPLSRPMPSVGSGVSELRLRDRDGIYRAFYFTRSPKGILVFHAFVKKTRATSTQDMELGRKRLKELLNDKI